MTEKIPQHILVDLLPMYLAGEVSEKIRSLTDEHLRQDPQLARLAEMVKKVLPLQEIPAPITKETDVESFKKGKKLMIQRSVFSILDVLTTVLAVPATFGLRDETR